MGVGSGFKGVECGPELYKETIETVVAAVRQAGLEVVLINTPRGMNNWIVFCLYIAAAMQLYICSSTFIRAN